MIDYNEYINDTIHVLNSAGVNIMDIPEEERKLALDLEQKLNETVNNGARENFFEVLDEWKNIFISDTDFNTSDFLTDCMATTTSRPII